MNRVKSIGGVTFGWSMIFSEKPVSTFPDHALGGWSMTFSENRFPLFRIML
jgi:hypothetical protein